MYRLLIVDDEKQVREGLKLLLPWEEYGIEICGEAQNGKEALEIMEKEPPHIVLMDIQMPVMNGIELAEKIRELYEECKFIVLSGYDDFVLVRQAMKLGAVDYLLKPCSKESIIQILEEVIDAFEDEITSRLHNDEQMRLSKNNILSRLVSGPAPFGEIREKLDLLEINLKKGPFAVIAVEILIDKRYKNEEEYYQEMVRAFKIFEENLSYGNKGIVFTNSTGDITIIVQEYEGWKKDRYLKNVLEKCVKEVYDRLQADSCIAVGMGVASCRKLYESYQKAQDTLAYKTVFGTGNVLFFDEIEEYFNGIPEYHGVNSEEFKDIIHRNNIQELRQYVHNLMIFRLKIDSEKEIYVLKNIALELIILGYQCFDEKMCADRNELYENKNHAMSEIMICTTAEDVISKLIKELEQIMEKISMHQKENYSKIIFDTIYYIESYYRNPNLSLQYLADEFHVNAAYLGRVFRKETGSSFADYLNNYRIKKAENLLLSTNYKGIELAENVGFSSYNYFYIVFKKITGKKPMDIRKDRFGLK